MEPTIVYILITGDETIIESFDLTRDLQDAGFTTFLPRDIKMERRTQWQESDERNADFVVLIENPGEITVKASSNGEQRTYRSIEELINYLQGDES